MLFSDVVLSIMPTRPRKLVLLYISLIILGYGMGSALGEDAQATIVKEGRPRDGLVFRFLWFERQEETVPGHIRTFVFPVGSPYGSQDLRDVQPILTKSSLTTDSQGNLSLTYDTPITVLQGRPILLGFVADVTQYSRAYAILDESKDTITQHSPRVVRAFLKDLPEYNLAHDQVRMVRDTLVNGDPDECARLNQIWDYVHSHMRYGYCKRPITGAELLRVGSGYCGEFARLTVTLARACGVPAREVHSLAASSWGPVHNDHAWAEFYITGMGWLPIQSQEPVPTDSRLRLDYNAYLVVFRGSSYKIKHRIIETEGLIDYGHCGCGFFASIPADVRRETVKLLQRIVRDDGTRAARLLKKVCQLPRQAQPALCWALSATPAEITGKKAARRLVELCEMKESRLHLDRFLTFSPAMVRARIHRAQYGELIPTHAALRNGHHYCFFDQPMTWPAAKKHCKALGGHLVTFSNAEEHEFVANIVPRLDKGHRVWIGLSDRDRDGTWEWVSGEHLIYMNWGKGLPDNLTGDQDCAEMGYAGKAWNDKPGRYRFGFICEWD